MLNNTAARNFGKIYYNILYGLWDVVQNFQISRNIFILEILSFDLMVVIFRFLAYVSRAFRIHIHAMHREFLRVASDVSNVLVWIQSALINNDVLT